MKQYKQTLTLIPDNPETTYKYHSDVEAFEDLNQKPQQTYPHPDEEEDGQIYAIDRKPGNGYTVTLKALSLNPQSKIWALYPVDKGYPAASDDNVRKAMKRFGYLVANYDQIVQFQKIFKQDVLNDYEKRLIAASDNLRN